MPTTTIIKSVATLILRCVTRKNLITHIHINHAAPANYFFTQHVKFTSANPFTPEFVKAHLATATGKSHARAHALYDERVRRRQLVLAERNHARGERERARTRRKGKGKGKGIVTTKAEKGSTAPTVRMGRREAAEKGVWQMRKEEARCAFSSTPSLTLPASEPFLPLSLLFIFILQVGRVRPFTSLMARVHVRVTWTGGGSCCCPSEQPYPCSSSGGGGDASRRRDASQACKGGLSWVDHDRLVSLQASEEHEEFG